MFSKLKRKIDQFLKTIAKQNQSQFGNDRMDCCDLKNQNKSKKR